MGDDGTAVGDELLAVPLPFGFLGLQAENLKGCGGAAAHRGDGRTAASIMKAIVQRQSVVGIGAVTTLKGCMDGIDGRRSATECEAVRCGATFKVKSYDDEDRRATLKRNSNED